MQRHLLTIAAVAVTLLVTSCSGQPSEAPASTAGTQSETVTTSPSAVATTETPAPAQTSGGSISMGTPNVAVSDAPTGANAIGKPGIATDAQMTVIDKVARAIANEKYDDAAAAGYYVFDSHGAFTQDASIMASKRAKHVDYFNTLKAEYAKGGCQLVPVKINSSGVIYANMTCNDGSVPEVSIHASFMNGKLAYIDALYVEN